MTGAPAAATVLDTTVLSNFAHVDAVESLLGLPRPVTVEEVETELDRGRDTHPYLGHALEVLGDGIPVVSPRPPARAVEQELLRTLDPGEAQALAVAAAVDGTVVTDDGGARAVADDRDIPATGSIGLLVRLVEHGRLSVATGDRYLKRWIDEAGFRSPARDLDTFLEDGGP